MKACWIFSRSSRRQEQSHDQFRTLLSVALLYWRCDLRLPASFVFPPAREGQGQNRLVGCRAGVGPPCIGEGGFGSIYRDCLCFSVSCVFGNLLTGDCSFAATFMLLTPLEKLSCNVPFPPPSLPRCRYRCRCRCCRWWWCF